MRNITLSKKPRKLRRNGDKMNPAYVYLQIYRLFDKHTPINADCGRFCSKACCKGDDSGMYLFPGEQSVFKLLNPEWARTDVSDFIYEYKGRKKNTPILFCGGNCDRYQRPLACRIFPLTPYIDDRGKLKVIIDPRARSVCPLSALPEVSDFNSSFVKNIKRAFAILSENEEVYAFLNTYSRMIDEYARFFDLTDINR